MALTNRAFEYVLLSLGERLPNSSHEALPTVLKINGDKSAMRAEAEALARKNPGSRYAICVWNGVVEAEIVPRWDD